MAWTDQCKIQAVESIKKTAELEQISIRRAITKIAGESDIPAATLDRWFYPREKSDVKNDVTQQERPDKTTDSGERLPAIKRRSEAVNDLVAGKITLDKATDLVWIGDQAFPASVAAAIKALERALLDSFDPQDAKKTLNFVIGTGRYVIDHWHERRDGQVDEPEVEPEIRHAILNGVVYDGLRFADMSICQLERIKPEDPNRVAALERVLAWIDDELREAEVRR